MPTPLADFGYPLAADSDGLGKPPEPPVRLPTFGQGQYLQATKKAQRTTQLTLLFSGDLFAAKRRKGRPVEGRQARNALELIVKHCPQATL